MFFGGLVFVCFAVLLLLGGLVVLCRVCGEFWVLLGGWVGVFCV